MQHALDACMDALPSGSTCVWLPVILVDNGDLADVELDHDPLLRWPTPAVACCSVRFGGHVEHATSFQGFRVVNTVSAHTWLAHVGCTADPPLYCNVMPRNIQRSLRANLHVEAVQKHASQPASLPTLAPESGHTSEASGRLLCGTCWQPRAGPHQPQHLPAPTSVLRVQLLHRHHLHTEPSSRRLLLEQVLRILAHPVAHIAHRPLLLLLGRCWCCCW